MVMVLWPKTSQQVPKSNIEYSNVHNSAVQWAIFDEKEAPDRKSMSAIRWKGRKAFISDKNGPKLDPIFFNRVLFLMPWGGYPTFFARSSEFGHQIVSWRPDPPHDGPLRSKRVDPQRPVVARVQSHPNGSTVGHVLFWGCIGCIWAV